MTALVVFSLEPWDAVRRRNQYLIDGLLRDDRELSVLYVEPARDLLHDAVHGRRPGRGAGLRTAPGYGGRLRLYAPTKWLPRRVGPLADAMLGVGVRRAWRSMDDAAVVWVNDPGWARFAIGTGCPVVYDMTDDWTAADRSAREHDRVVANDGLLLGAAAAVIVCSQGLASSRRAARPDLVLIPNAVDVQRYRRPAARPPDAAAEYAVYVGTLHEDRLDVDLVARTGARLAEAGARLVLVGPNALSSANTERLIRAAGVDLLGPRPYSAVPAYLQHAAVLVVPHVVSEFTDSLDPIKLYEYRAVGRPIVSTRVAGFRDLEGEPGVTVADADDFPGRVVEALERPAKGRQVDVADWSGRVAAVATVLRRVRAHRPGDHAASTR